jgi:hypothetical protein
MTTLRHLLVAASPMLFIAGVGVMQAGKVNGGNNQAGFGYALIAAGVIAAIGAVCWPTKNP